MYLPDLPLAIF